MATMTLTLRTPSTFSRLDGTNTETRDWTCLSSRCIVSFCLVVSSQSKKKKKKKVKAQIFQDENNGLNLLFSLCATTGLNEKLKACNSPMTVVAFIITPAETHSFTVETLKGQAVVKQLKETVHGIAKRMETRLFEKAAR